MTNYVKSTNFASKDSLSVGNPLKVVKGTEIDAEFNNIATASATKADSASPVFTGTVVAPTPALSATGTTVATVAAIQALYPIGSIYINAGVTTNPGTLLGFGTWAAFGAGKVAVGFNSSNALFDSLEETGGSADAVIVSHTHTATVTDPAHTHTGSTYQYLLKPPYIGSLTGNDTNGSGIEQAIGTSDGGVMETVATGITVANTATGVSGTNANYQPYITVCMWKRTA
jgi:hypothetical protein